MAINPQHLDALHDHSLYHHVKKGTSTQPFLSWLAKMMGVPLHNPAARWPHDCSLHPHPEN